MHMLMLHGGHALPPAAGGRGLWAAHDGFTADAGTFAPLGDEADRVFAIDGFAEDDIYAVSSALDASAFPKRRRQ